MNRALINSLTEAEYLLVMETEPAALAGLDEDELRCMIASDVPVPNTPSCIDVRRARRSPLKVDEVRRAQRTRVTASAPRYSKTPWRV
jgi:hypothetical protein